MSQDLIREYIEITESMFVGPLPQPEILTEEVLVEHVDPVLDPAIQQKLEDLIFKLRNYQDPEVGEYAAGMEAGMSQAADMLENLITRIKGE